MVQINVDNTIETAETKYFDTLEFYYSELVQVLGDPIKSGSEDDEWEYEWKLVVTFKDKEYIYTIYDWKDEEYDEIEELEDREWYIGGVKTNKKLTDMVIKYIDDHITERVECEECEESDEEYQSDSSTSSKKSTNSKKSTKVEETPKKKTKKVESEETPKKRGRPKKTE